MDEESFYAIGDSNGPYLHMQEYRSSKEAADAIPLFRDHPMYGDTFSRLDRVFRVTRTVEWEEYEWHPKKT